MQVIYTNVPKYRDTYGDIMVRKMKEEKGDRFVRIYGQILWNFWSGEGFILENDSSDVSEMIKYFSEHFEDEIEDVQYVIEIMLEHEYLLARPYDMDTDGVLTYEDGVVA